MRIERFLEGLGRKALQKTLDVEAPAVLRPTSDPKHGDYQINGVLPLAKQLKKNPRELGQAVADAITGHEAIAEAVVAGPGFVNLRLRDAWVADRLGEALRDRARDGVERVEHPQKIVVDYSSPNIAK